LAQEKRIGRAAGWLPESCVVQLRPLVELLLTKENIFWNIVFFLNILFF
jgi:hypothetical protein